VGFEKLLLFVMPEITCRASMFLLFLDSRQKNAGMTDGALDSRQNIAGMTAELYRIWFCSFYRPEQLVSNPYILKSDLIHSL
jgi:hypothetical protein